LKELQRNALVKKEIAEDDEDLISDVNDEALEITKLNDNALLTQDILDNETTIKVEDNIILTPSDFIHSRKFRE